jgi:Raf kinase inhibitor-like YbhB/YbcL family protein
VSISGAGVRSFQVLTRVPALLLCAVAAGCAGGSADHPAAEEVPASIDVHSSAFDAGGPIPRRFTCDGEEVSPPLSWDGVPDKAGALALVVDDPDAPGGTYVHWVVLDVDADADGVEVGEMPSGGVPARNSAGRSGYTGPCPPGGRHRYRFTVYALDAPTGLRAGADLRRALAAVRAHAVARGTLTGTYRR